MPQARCGFSEVTEISRHKTESIPKRLDAGRANGGGRQADLTSSLAKEGGEGFSRKEALITGVHQGETARNRGFRSRRVKEVITADRGELWHEEKPDPRRGDFKSERGEKAGLKKITFKEILSIQSELKRSIESLNERRKRRLL